MTSLTAIFDDKQWESCTRVCAAHDSQSMLDSHACTFHQRWRPMQGVYWQRELQPISSTNVKNNITDPNLTIVFYCNVRLWLLQMKSLMPVLALIIGAPAEAKAVSSDKRFISLTLPGFKGSDGLSSHSNMLQHSGSSGCGTSRQLTGLYRTTSGDGGQLLGLQIQRPSRQSHTVSHVCWMVSPSS